ncbi:hypothetical protein [Amycolatopsis sp. Hca4]|nr:hypothetical protein [Amycolatopsis sp. Hca4]
MRTHFLGENPVPEFLRSDHFVVGVRDEKRVPRGVGGELDTRLISADEEL